MKRLSMLLMIAVLTAACTTVPAGHVGVVVNQWGEQKGVNDLPVKTGRFAYNPISTDVFVFPTYNQIVVWDADADGDNDAGNESITFLSARQASINIDTSVNFHIQADKVPHIYLEFRQDLLSLERGYIRGRVQHYFNLVGGQMDTFDILGPKIADLSSNVLKLLQAELTPKGIIIDTVSILGKPRVDPNVEAAMRSVTEQQLSANRAEAMVRQVEAEGRQNVAKQKAAAEAAIAEAEGIARSMILRSEAEAQSNRLVAASITDAYIRYRQIEAQRKWDGALPKMMFGGGAIPMVQLPVEKP